MESSLRTAPGLLARIDRLRDDLIKRFEAIVGGATIDKTDRNTTAVVEYQMQVETSALIRVAEELQTLIRNLQETWLFGQLKTVGNDETRLKTNESAREVADLLKQLLDKNAHQLHGEDDAMVTAQ